jgi:hypothetical protein
VLSGSGLSDMQSTRAVESYRLWCVIVCDLRCVVTGIVYESLVRGVSEVAP